MAGEEELTAGEVLGWVNFGPPL